MSRLILGIETSCDETAAAVYSSTRGILSSELFSQIALHQQYGGVVPELASRSHLEKINMVIQAALDRAHTPLAAIDAVAVTSRPGLAGSLLIGLCFAKAIAASTQKKLIGVNHLEGHIFSSFLEHTPPFPHLCLTASGGHTSLYLVHAVGSVTLLGQTVDDAAGEAFDKVAKVLQLPYPGGPVLEKLAATVGFQDFFHYPRTKNKTLDFSFSGLKTAILYDLIKRGVVDSASKTFSAQADDAIKAQVASSLHVCVADMFEAALHKAFKQHPEIKAVTFVGGVACNKYLRARIEGWCTRHALALFVPSPKFCTDNGAMIAFVGSDRAEKGKFADLTLDILSE